MGSRNARVGRTIRLGAAVAALAVAAGLTAGCGAGNSGSVGGAGGTAVATTPAPAGDLARVTWALPYGEPTTLDYAKAGDYSPDALISIMCDDLLRMNPDFTYGPGLATAWRNPDPKTLVYTIRSGVKFWDGSPLTAADVVASLKRNMDPKAEPVNGGFYANVSSIEKTGPLEVTVRFKRPDELFNKEMATVAGAVAKATYMQQKGTKFGTPTGGMMCTGPYKLTSWQSGTGITVTRNDHYWDPKLRPRVGRFDFKFVTDSSTLTSALQSGAIDGAYEVPMDAAATLAHSATGKLYQGPSLQVIEILPAQAKGPVADVRIREALNLAIDRAGLARNVYGNRALPNRTLVPSSVWQANPAKAAYRQAFDALPPLTQDIAKAKQLVAQAGTPARPLVLAIQAGDHASLQTATFVQAVAKQIGLGLTIRQLQATAFSNAFYAPNGRAGIDLVLTSGWVDVSDPLDYAPLFAQPGGIFNWLNYDKPEVNQALDAARASLDPATSAAEFAKAQATYTKDQIVIPLLNKSELLYMNKRLTGAPASFAYIFSPWAAYVGKAG